MYVIVHAINDVTVNGDSKGMYVAIITGVFCHHGFFVSEF